MTWVVAGSRTPNSPGTDRPNPGLSVSLSWSTPQWPSSKSSVNTTALGQERNVLQNTEMITTRSDRSQRMHRLLARFTGELCAAVTSATEPASPPDTPNHWPGVTFRISTSKFPPTIYCASTGTGWLRLVSGEKGIWADFWPVLRLTTWSVARE